MHWNNESSQTTEGMRANPGLMAAVLAVMSLLSFSLVSLLCLWCKRKSKIVQVEDQVYNPRTFRHGGSVFTVTRSKTVTRANQIAPGETCFSVSADTAEDQSDYENIINARPASADHAYVDPLPSLAYRNEERGKKISIRDQNPGVYANVTHSSSQDEDYENSQFLNEAEKQEDEEPDYVNESGEW
ncbi:unnamed protein product [Tetraodon nigroviridis]|uniref:(spotted green pufferfish) hypothetical protein n=1 Tax=Tetraodon nigroviridis TaxID=99883 RepID=Q4SPX3_TETNG|nr:unnamed protein product [Tetraodon nigroviridis]